MASDFGCRLTKSDDDVPDEMKVMFLKETRKRIQNFLDSVNGDEECLESREEYGEMVGWFQAADFFGVLFDGNDKLEEMLFDVYQGVENYSVDCFMQVIEEKYIG